MNHELFSYKRNGIFFVYLHPGNQTNDFLAQPVEQLTLNQWVRSSILRGVTKKRNFLK
jgi:hypothetical protein